MLSKNKIKKLAKAIRQVEIGYMQLAMRLPSLGPVCAKAIKNLKAKHRKLLQ